MSKVFKNFTLMIVSLLYCTGLSGQQLGLELKVPQGIIYQNNWGYFQDGAELSLDYRLPADLFDFIIGVNMRTIDWGSQITASISLSHTFQDRIDLQFELQNGLALFYEKPLFVYSLELACRYSIYYNDKIRMGISLGTRFTHCPAYRYFGNIDRVIEIPVGLYLNF